MRLAGWIRLAVVFLGLALQASAQGEPTLAPDSTRARLETLSQAERLRLARNLEQFQRLPPRTRTKLLERARVLRERERALGQPFTDERGAPLREGDLALHEAGKRWRTHLRERGREVRERLPEPVRRRLEQASPELRRRFLERLGESQERLVTRVLTRARERHELSPGEAQRLERLPKREQVRALREHYAARRFGR